MIFLEGNLIKLQGSLVLKRYSTTLLLYSRHSTDFMNCNNAVLSLTTSGLTSRHVLRLTFRETKTKRPRSGPEAQRQSPHQKETEACRWKFQVRASQLQLLFFTTLGELCHSVGSRFPHLQTRASQFCPEAKHPRPLQLRGQ